MKIDLSNTGVQDSTLVLMGTCSGQVSKYCWLYSERLVSVKTWWLGRTVSYHSQESREHRATSRVEIWQNMKWFENKISLIEFLLQPFAAPPSSAQIGTESGFVQGCPWTLGMRCALLLPTHLWGASMHWTGQLIDLRKRKAGSGNVWTRVQEREPFAWRCRSTEKRKVGNPCSCMTYKYYVITGPLDWEVQSSSICFQTSIIYNIPT